MMALSFINLPTTGPAAPAAPPGIVPAPGAFDLLLPVADPADPRHEPAPDGNDIGKDMPVDATDAPTPLAWLSPPVAAVSPPVSIPQPPEAAERTPAISAPVAAASATTPRVTSPLPCPTPGERSPIAAQITPTAVASAIETVAPPAPRTEPSRGAATNPAIAPIAAQKEAKPPAPTPAITRIVSRPPTDEAPGDRAKPVRAAVPRPVQTAVTPDAVIFATAPLREPLPTTATASFAAPIVPNTPTPTPSITRAVSRPPVVDAPVSPVQPAPTAAAILVQTPAPDAAILAAAPVREVSPATSPSIERIVSRPLIESAPVGPAQPALTAAAMPVPATVTPTAAILAAPIREARPAAATTPPAASGALPRHDTRDFPLPVGRVEPPVAMTTPPAAPALTAPRIAPAAQVFADAIHRAARDDRAPAAPDAAALITADIKTHAVTATADAQHGALDLRQEHWPARMIERIDALRDAANANDTSIRLIPDALGKIDVSLKRDGDTVAVQFTAQQPETRQLLADAAPKLAELAEARGLKLAQHGADTASQQQRQQPSTSAAVAPDNRERRRAEADESEPTDTRIA